MSYSPVKKGQKFTLDDVFEPIIYLITFPDPKGYIIVHVKVVGFNDQEVKKTLRGIHYLTNRLVNSFQLSDILDVKYEKSDQMISFLANENIDYDVELTTKALEYDTQNGHFHLSQSLFTVLSSNFKNVVVV